MVMLNLFQHLFVYLDSELGRVYNAYPFHLSAHFPRATLRRLKDPETSSGRHSFVSVPNKKGGSRLLLPNHLFYLLSCDMKI